MVAQPFSSYPYENLRISDAQRHDTINYLAVAVGEGRLSMEEFEQRTDAVMEATTQQELGKVCADIPVGAEVSVKEFSRAELEKARAEAKKPRLATALIGTIGLNFAGISLTAFGAYGDSLAGILGGIGVLALIPVLWILLYVAKVGPDSWNVPSPQQIERQQLRELRALSAKQRAEQKQLEAQMWAKRRQQAGELTGEALDLAKRAIDRMHRR